MVNRCKILGPLCLSLGIIFGFSCSGQQRGVRTLTVHSDEVKEKLEVEGGFMTVFQDRQGNHWFWGSELGLYRYDGKELTLWTKEDGLCSHKIIGVQEDQEGNLYFDTPEGVSKFDGKKFSTLKIHDGPLPASGWQLNKEDLWFRMGWNHSGPFRYDGQFLYALELPKSEQEQIFRSKYPNVSYNPYGIYCIYKDREGNMWFGTSSLGICRYDGNSHHWMYEDHLTNTPQGGSFGIRSIFQDQKGRYWFTNTNYSYEIPVEQKEGSRKLEYRRLEGPGYRNENNRMKPPYFMSMTEDDQGGLWMASFGLGVWHKTGQELVNHAVEGKEGKQELFSIYKDRDGKLWVGTQKDGVYYLEGQKFVKFRLDK
ncbi:MAG: hypothetical protein EP338_09370 [Bacteroidetes bacterium]|nr:MAG: hypothetical protein EP338_09370 [Bacteroidota bacterium]